MIAVFKALEFKINGSGRDGTLRGAALGLGLAWDAVGFAAATTGLGLSAVSSSLLLRAKRGMLPRQNR
ncbi:MAG: hypothetical protein ACPGUZ_01100 [Holosporaceae bacterium]